MKNSEKKLLWDSILEQKSFKEFDINNFKEEGTNARITQYNYMSHGILFLKNILFQMAETFQPKQLSLLKRVKNRHIGGGVSISYTDIELDLDYLLSLKEVLFLKPTLESINSVLEIGAGYGRTCHTILSLFPSISEYRILDLSQMLKLSYTYLKTVSTEENFRKINFIPVGSAKYKEPVDLIVNIDSMQEMDSKTVKNYLYAIDIWGKFFYSNNTVGKFDPSLCGWDESESSRLALKSGILKDKLNIFCPNELKKAQDNFLKKFLPTDKWSIVQHSTVLPWSHYYQVLFKKNV